MTGNRGGATRCLGFCVCLLVFAVGCFDYGGGSGGGSTANVGTATVTKKTTPQAGEPNWQIQGAAGVVEVFLHSPKVHDKVTFRPKTGSVLTTYFSTQSDVRTSLGAFRASAAGAHLRPVNSIAGKTKHTETLLSPRSRR